MKFTNGTELYCDDITRRAKDSAAGIVNPVPYHEYHALEKATGDCDPAYNGLLYLADRFELNTEQRYWLAYLYSTCYSGATTFYIYNEFPDLENIDAGRLERWWSANKSSLIFQTDRRWVRSRNQWCGMVIHYRDTMARRGGQEAFFKRCSHPVPEYAYQAAFQECGMFKQYGRYSLFLLLEAVHVLTGFNIRPDNMDMSEAESSRNGLAEAIGRPDLNTHSGGRITRAQLNYLQNEFQNLLRRETEADPETTVWSLETTLCAYKKYRIGKRWIGYYLDREHDEILKLERAVKRGVAWEVLWQYRDETYHPEMLKEKRR